uniref:Uncharacterized protein n=1 Tax=viral metagenome TaxID=1070528 RepID=A0A2V0RBB4_9ZZZZ
MYNLNTNSLRNRRTSVVTNYNIPPRGPSGPLPILNPLPGDVSQPTTGSPIPGQGNSGFRVPNQAGSTPANSGGTSSSPSSNPKPQTVSLPQDKKAKKTKQKSKRKTTRSLNPLLPSSDRPELLKFTGGDRSPTGDMPYRDGPAVFTPDRPFGKISELPNAGQFIQPWDSPADVMSNVRTLVQIISAVWFPQFPSQKSGANDQNLNKNQENIFLTMFNQIRYIYQERFNINLGFTEAFTVSNVFVYFFDVHALHAELVCLLQRAAYYRNYNAGMENLVLDNLACILNNIDIDSVRNRMARALRFSYLPKSVIDETYETFQSYRMSGLVTSPSTIYVTKNMGTLMTDLGAATTLDEYTKAVKDYSDAIDILISRVVDGRPANTSSSTGIQRYWNWSNNVGAYSQGNANVFEIGDSGLTLSHQIMLNSVFARVAPHTNLTLLNNVMEGNSRSEIDVNFNDRFNNQLTLATSNFVMPKIQGGATIKDAPKPATAVAFASDRRAEEVSYKSVMYQSEKFSGGGALFFSTDRPGTLWSRIYLKERAPVSGLQPEQDVRFTTVSHYTRVIDNTYPFVQDNYVAKAFTSNGTNWHYAQNTDSNSAAMWFVTFGDLMEQQYQHGIDILK